MLFGADSLAEGYRLNVPRGNPELRGTAGVPFLSGSVRGGLLPWRTVGSCQRLVLALL